MQSSISHEQEFSSEELRLKVERKPSCMVSFVIDILPPLAKEGHKRAVKSVSKEVSLPGFRKGKAPEDLVAKKHGKEIHTQWEREVAYLALPICEKLSHVSPITRETKISYQMKNLSFAGAHLTITFEVEPIVPTVDPSHFVIKEAERPVIDSEKVEEMVKQIRYFYAKWNQITDRAVQMDDCVQIDLDSLEENPPLAVYRHTRFEVTDKMAGWMRDLLLGMRVGESKEGVSVPDAGAKDETELSPKKVLLTLKAIEEAELPPLDDAFAKQLGVAHIDDLRSSIERLLNKKVEAHSRETLRVQASDFLLTQYPFDIPPSAVEKEVRFRMNQISRDQAFIEYWNQLPEQERKNMVQSIYQQSEKALRLFYLCRKILTDAGITVSEKDLPEPVTEPLEMLLNPQPEHLLNPQPEVRLAEAYSRLTLEKAEDYLIQHGKRAAV